MSEEQEPTTATFKPTEFNAEATWAFPWDEKGGKS